MPDVKKLGRVSTGIPGLDVVLAGGFFETGVYIIEGPAGAGKTILANQLCFHQVANGKRAIYYTLLTEAHDRMLGFMRDLAFFDASVIPQQLTYVSGFKVLEAEGLPGVLRSIRDTISARGASLLVVDGLVSAEEVSPNDSAFKKFIHEIQTASAMFRCTVILLTNTEATNRLNAEHTMVDGIIELGTAGVRMKPHRVLIVHKLRGAGQVRGEHTLELTAQGVVVRPRIEATIPPPDKQATSVQTRRPMGIPTLDAVIGGGIPSASNTMVMGPSGTGKTILGVHFLAGGLVAGENALLFTFYEQATELVEKAARFGIDFAGPLKSGQLQVVWQSSVEASLDKIGHALLAAFAKHRPTRILIDSMQGFQVTADAKERIEDFFAAIADFFIAEGATMMFTAESNDLLGDVALRVPFPNASRMCQNIFVLRHSELGGRVHKLFSVFKMRDSDFDASVREITIGDRGIEIGEPIVDADRLLGGQPLRTPVTKDGRRGR
ncbi:MAG TPA: ATPase domain-containing protein [Polyangiaceae bacterium]|nr:ATPase domain-containing protein [Polyangiaceae bacterium]